MCSGAAGLAQAISIMARPKRKMHCGIGFSAGKKSCNGKQAAAGTSGQDQASPRFASFARARRSNHITYLLTYLLIKSIATYFTKSNLLFSKRVNSGSWPSSNFETPCAQCAKRQYYCKCLSVNMISAFNCAHFDVHNCA
jgi:hypothetical protein